MECSPKRGGLMWLMGHIHYRGDDCVLWPYSTDTKGYAQVTVGVRQIKKANRIMCELAYGPPPTPRHQAAHSCGIRHCINPRHLSWKTQSENEADKKIHGTLVQNYWGRAGKLSQEQRELIRTSDESAVKLAEQLGVRRGTIEWWRKKFECA